MKLYFMNKYKIASIVLGVHLIILSCAPSRFVNTLPKGETQVGFSLGGAMQNLFGLTIPTPYSSVVVGHGLRDDITIYGKGNQTRSFCFVSDTVSGIIKAMTSESSEVFNIGNPNEITILQLAEFIIKFTESKSVIKYMELPEDDPMQRKPDISKAVLKLNWEPEIKLEEGLNKTINWVKTNFH